MTLFKQKNKLKYIIHPVRFLDRLEKANEIKAQERLDKIKLTKPSGKINNKIIDIIAKT